MSEQATRRMTVREAAKYAQVSSALIYQWCDELRLAHYRLGGEGRRGRILIDPADLDRLIQQCRVDPHPLLGE